VIHRRSQLEAVLGFAIFLVWAASACSREPPPQLAPSQPVQANNPSFPAHLASDAVTSKGSAESDEEQDSDNSLDDDQDEDDSEQRTQNPSRPHPFAEFTDAELRELYRKDPTAVGSVSIGRPNAGRLANGVRPKESPLYHLVDPIHAFGTTETVDDLCHVLQVVADKHPGTQMVDVGHLSASSGGPLSPHRSHQSGRDVDLGLYYNQPGTRWYTRASGNSLDLPRTWTLIRTLATDTDIEMILLDRKLQSLVEKYAYGVERDTSFVRRLFHGDEKHLALVRHSPGHATHLHLRFRNPIARETGRRLGPLLELPRKVLSQSAAVTYHVASTGDTLAKLAQRYKTTMAAIRAANHMRTYQLVAGHRYVIPTSLDPDSLAPNARGSNHSKPKR